MQGNRKDRLCQWGSPLNTVRILVAALAIFQSTTAEAQKLKQAPKNKGILKHAIEVYTGGVEYGTAITTPNRDERQTTEGSAGALKAFAGGANLIGKIGGVRAAMLPAMAVPISDGIEPMSIWIGSDHHLARKLQLAKEGNIEALEREEVKGILRRQEAGRHFNETATYRLAHPPENSGELAEKFADYQRDTIPNAQRYAASNTQTAVLTQNRRPAKDEGWNGTINRAPDQSASLDQQETPIEEQEETATQDALPLHWKTVSAVARTNGQVVPLMGMEIGKCEPLRATDAYEYIAMERAAPEGFGQNCSAAQFIDNSRDRITYTQSCQDPDTGAVEVHNSLRAKDARTIESYLKLNLGGGATSELQAVMAYCG